MKLIAGLGNPGPAYALTRHNLGFRVIETLRKELAFEDWQTNQRFKAEISQGQFQKEKIILSRPLTFMNQSGQSIKALLDFYQLPLSSLLVIHDEWDLPLGQVRLSRSSGSAGHQGVESIIAQLKSQDFARIRLGIKPENQTIKQPAQLFVLKEFQPAEEKIVKKAIDKAVKIILTALSET